MATRTQGIFEAQAVAPPGRELAAEDDLELVAAVRRGDDRAFERLYHRYSRRVWSYALSMVKDHGRAEDVTQEVFISALRRLRNCQQPIVLKPWLYEIARNACIDQYRRAHRAQEVSYDAETANGTREAADPVSSAPPPEAAVAIKLTLDHLQDAFGGLSSNQHDLLVMRELEGLSYREMSDRTGLSRAAVESGLFRARRRLLEEYTSLDSGDRCQRIQRAIKAAAEGRSGARARWRIARHVTHCAHCRHHAILAGLDPRQLRSLAGRVAALVPVPAFVRRWAETRASTGPTRGVGGHVTHLAQWSATLGSAADPVIASWATAGAAAAVAIGLGTGGIDLGSDRTSAKRLPAPARHAASAPVRRAAALAPAAAGGRTVTVHAGARRAVGPELAKPGARGASAAATDAGGTADEQTSTGARGVAGGPGAGAPTGTTPGSKGGLIPDLPADTPAPGLPAPTDTPLPAGGPPLYDAAGDVSQLGSQATGATQGAGSVAAGAVPTPPAVPKPPTPDPAGQLGRGVPLPHG